MEHWYLLLLLIPLVLLLAACARKQPQPGESGETGEQEEPAGTYIHIDQETARQMMALDDGHVVVDVRRQDEYEAGHIPGAILIPNESIGTERPAELPDPDQVILVYCRSGVRSKQASQKLADMGYANVYEFGGILSWTGDTVEGKEPWGTENAAARLPEITFCSMSRTGDIAWDDDLRITKEEDGYYLSANGEEKRKIGTGTVRKIEEIYARYDMGSWNGFAGESEALDGEGFSMEFAFSDGSLMTAKGSNSFPKDYFRAIGEIWEIFIDGGFSHYKRS